MNNLQALINKGAPELGIKALKIIEKGWDSLVCVVNNKYIFRFPRRKDTTLCLEIEKRILPELRKTIDLKIPSFKFVYGNSRDFQNMFVGYEKIEGEEFSKEIYQAFKRQGVLDKIAKQIAEFLSKLHNFSVRKAKILGVKEKGNLSWWRKYFKDVQSKVFPHLTEKEKDWAEGLFIRFLSNKENFKSKKVLIHGDFGDLHILVDKYKTKVVGVIDFGDIAIDDAAHDFRGLKAYEDSFVESVLKYYKRKVDEDFTKRINFYYEVTAFSLLLGGINLRRDEYFKEGMDLLRLNIKRSI